MGWDTTELWMPQSGEKLLSGSKRITAVSGPNLLRSDEGLIATMTLPGGSNTASFMVDIERILLPRLWKGAIIVMDSLPVHHAKTVET